MMKNKMYKILSIVLATTLFMGAGIQLYASSTQQQLNEAQQQANQVTSEIQQGKQELENLEDERNAISGQLNKYNNQLSAAVNALNDTEFSIRAKELEIEQKLEELAKAQQIEDKQYADLMEHLKFMYESGVTQSYLNLVSEVTSLTEFMNLSEYVEQISAYDTMMLERFRATREFIQQEEAELQRDL